MRAGIEPSRAASEEFHVQLTALEVEAVQVGNFEFAAPGRLQAAGQRDDLGVIEIQPRNSVE